MIPASAMAATALRRVAGALGPRGQWPGWAEPDAAPEEGRRDLAPPLTAMGMLAVKGLTVPGADALLRRSRTHVVLTVRPEGLWRYYANIPPDADDTAICALALGTDHPAVRGRTAATLAASRMPDGRFPTWLGSTDRPVIDAVTNAHVVAVVGEGPATSAAVRWLTHVVAEGRHTSGSRYYLDPLDLHVAVTRAREAGVTSLAEAVDIAAARATRRLADAGDLSAHRIAQAVIVASRARTPDVAVLRHAATRLQGLVESDGTWAAETLFVAADSLREGDWRYCSWAVTTATCARALVLAGAAGGAPR